MLRRTFHRSHSSIIRQRECQKCLPYQIPIHFQHECRKRAFWNRRTSPDAIPSSSPVIMINLFRSYSRYSTPWNPSLLRISAEYYSIGTLHNCGLWPTAQGIITKYFCFKSILYHTIGVVIVSLLACMSFVSLSGRSKGSFFWICLYSYARFTVTGHPKALKRLNTGYKNILLVSSAVHVYLWDRFIAGLHSLISSKETIARCWQG